MSQQNKSLAVQIIDALTRLVNAIAEGGLLVWFVIIIIVVGIFSPSEIKNIIDSLF